MTFRFKESLIMILIPAFAFLEFNFFSGDIITISIQLPTYAILYLGDISINIDGSQRILTLTLDILSDSYLDSDNWANIGDNYSLLMMLGWILALALAVISLVCNFIAQRELAGITLILCGLLMALVQLLAFMDFYSDNYIPIPFGWIGCIIIGYWIYTYHR
ncbi:MAG: hypothetical protein ACFFCQ_10445 [Promethearchaeota archaeon]